MPAGPRRSCREKAPPVLLATAFLHLLPEALESQASAKELFGTLLVGLVFAWSRAAT